MTGFSKILPSVQKFKAAIQKSRKAGAKDKDRLERDIPGSSSTLGLDSSRPLPPWGVPVEIQILIFANCGTADFLPLKLTCRTFNQVLSSHEHEIVRQYLRQRRHGTLPSPIDIDRTYTRSPEDDVVLLSDLFPPSKSARGGHLYTFRYLHGLRQRQRLCSRLAYYLADSVMNRYVQEEQNQIDPKKSNRALLLKRAKDSMWFYIAPLMYYTLYYLEAYSSARREHTNMLLREYEAGKLAVPVPLDMRRKMYRDLQTRILREPPFTNTAALLATHHCMHLLVSNIRHTIPEGEPDDSWISSLLALSPFVRIVEYFSAEIGDGGNQRMQRKDFMYNFYHDMNSHEKDHMISVIWGRAADQNVQNMHSSVRDLWFDAARAELKIRNANPHRVEDVFHWNGVPIQFGCPDCHRTRGWWA
ncbi:hypothetical protein N7478_009685 [Penicillium angulare]|uniref:uncharacterized protein n=1 Tax=Penicillium angulare TaxID=116970 RepID=UPI002541FD90|nr:uncharacterized protein N7478_009685 [Penicillium angulare]KAJ5266877.1 hypothetical protein N7478_009685 [Penicillium angulare]